MAFDAAAANAASPVRSAGKGPDAARADRSGEKSPFGALMALLDNAGETPTEQPAVPLKPAVAAEDAAADMAADPAAQDAPVVASESVQAADVPVLAFVVITPPAVQPVLEAVAPAITPPGPSLSPPAEAVAFPPVPETGAAAIPAEPSVVGQPVQTASVAAIATVETKPAPELTEAKIRSAPAPAPDLAAAAAQIETQPAKTESSPPAQVPAHGVHERLADAEPRQTTGDIRRAEAGGRDVAANGVQGPAPQGGHGEGHTYGDRSQDRRSGAKDNGAGLARGKAETAPAAAAFAAAIEPALTAAPAEAAPATNPAQSAPAAPASAASTLAQAPMIAPVRGSPEMVAHLAAQMIQRLDGQSTRFDLALTPENMGRVQVRIEIDRQGALKARMSFESPSTAQDMSGRHAELRAALESAGFDLAEGALSFDVASGGGGGRGEAFDQQPDAAPRLFQTLAEAADPVPALSPYFHGGARSAIDIRV